MKNILLIEDNETTRNILEQLLRFAGYEVVGGAENGFVGFNMYKELNPDLVILDIMMPDCDGIECLKLIKNFDHSAKVVLCTALDTSKLMNVFAELGVKDFIIKPFKANKVLGIVERILNEPK